MFQKNVAGVNVLCSGYETSSDTLRSAVKKTASAVLNIHSADHSVYKKSSRANASVEISTNRYSVGLGTERLYVANITHVRRLCSCVCFMHSAALV